ncbi:hematopoietic progenitor cell antigen CD34 [Chanos chanos]|uniref:Hematopoietic progenitor cell antigen CD34 n=1 Tax=Chanos chanos TaxID=29144 RepID=A0A6J2VPU4_CHACN|nr:hematopoietic progenitor cell antigen CD34-like [Chanos chanos]
MHVITGTTTVPMAVPFARGDMIEPTTAPADDNTQVQVFIFPTISMDLTAQPTQSERTDSPGPRGECTDGAVTDTDQRDNPGPTRRPDEPAVTPLGNVLCVNEAAVKDKDVVSLKLKAPSNCEDTRAKIQSVLEHLCGQDCKLELYQEDNSAEIVVYGQNIQDDAKGMAERFNNDNIKDKVGVEDAVPRWGKHSKAVLIAVLLCGLILAALLIAFYVIKNHLTQSKGHRLAEESFQVDEINQGNTLVSVTPLHPQEPLDKPTINGDSSENAASQPPQTNGHSATQNPVADTEM